MNEIEELLHLEQLCIPTMLEVLSETFNSDKDKVLSSNPSLKFSEDQLSNFAFDVLIENLQYDIKNLAENDPAAAQTSDKVKYVWGAYKGLEAIMYYRIANHLLDFDNNCLLSKPQDFFDTDEDDEVIRLSFDTEEDDELIKDYMKLQARRLSEKAAKETTIEINPSAKIGRGFVIDHGIGTKVAPGEERFSTVIGETCIIGENCTLLNSVLLGAAVINEASSGKEHVATGKRHPTLGNKVTVCAGVRILGDITVGNNVTIGPCCVITTDIPDNYYVSIVNQLQYSRPDKKSNEGNREAKPIIHGLTMQNQNFLLFGTNLSNCQLSIVSHEKGNEREAVFLSVVLIDISDSKLIFQLERNQEEVIRQTNYSLRIKTPSYEYILHEPYVLEKFIMELIGG